MGMNVTQKLIKSHLVEGEMKIGEEIGIKIDHTLTQDATGTMVMLELEAMGLKEAKTEVSCQYVDHNIIQNDFKNLFHSAYNTFSVMTSQPSGIAKIHSFI